MRETIRAQIPCFEEEEPLFVQIPCFKNAKLLDFSDPEVRERMELGIKQVRSRLGHHYPLLVSGNFWYKKETIRRENPSNINETVGYMSVAGERDADEVIRIIQASKEAKEWAHASFEERAVCLKKAAMILNMRREFFIALMMLEVGKTRKEADAEVCEAIDFLNYYAEYAPFLSMLNNATLLNPKGEKNSGMYLPLGIGVSIQPWNFPLAISCGPTAAGLVTGNAMIYKPAKYSSIIGYYLAQVFYDAGIPKDIFHFLPGQGSKVGNYLLGHPAVRVIAFTGSTQVANSINEEVYNFNSKGIKLLPPQDRHPKRIAALETGGKGAIIIDSDADLDEAVVGVCTSAFSFQGQKCSAGPRVIIVDDPKSSRGLYDKFIGRLIERIKSIEIGSPEDPKNLMGPMISKEAYKDVMEYMDIARQEGEILAEGKIPDELRDADGNLIGHFLPPMLVGNISHDSRVAQEEIFGPVLAAFRARDFDEALRLANNMEYGLTGGIFSRDLKNIKRAIREFDVGNLYVNNKITGAIVGRQPFGGFKMSGNGTKAGGWDYLLNFVNRKNVSTNTMCRGSVVE